MVLVGVRCATRGSASLLGNVLDSATPKRLKMLFVFCAEELEHGGIGLQRVSVLILEFLALWLCVRSCVLIEHSVLWCTDEMPSVSFAVRGG